MKLFKTIILTATFALSMSAGNEKLTTQDKRDIVKKYEAMLLGMPSSEVKKVDPALYYFDEEEIDARIKRDPQSIFASLAQGVKRVKVTKIQGLNIQVTFSYKGTATHLSTASKIGYVQLAPNGKIKYDPSHVRHPLEVAYDLNTQLCGRYNWLAKLADEKKPNEQHMKTLGRGLSGEHRHAR